MKRFLTLLLLLMPLTLFAQDKGSLSKAKEIDRLLYSTKLQIDTAWTTDRDYSNFDSLFRTYLREPATFYYRLDSLETIKNDNYAGRIITYAAPDKSFKLWAYVDGGGSQSFYKNYIQFHKADGSVDFEPFYFFGIEGEAPRSWSNPIIYEVHPFIYEGINYYILLMKKVYCGTDVCNYLAIARFEDGQPIYYTSFLPKEFQEQGYIEVQNTAWNQAKFSFNPKTMELSYREYDYPDEENTKFTNKTLKISLPATTEGKNANAND